MPDERPPELPDAPASATVVQQSPPLHLLGDSATDADSVAPRPAGATGGERYELLEEIARGGMGVVYCARDRVLDREVGLKTLLKSPGSAAAPRFLAEARITGQLQHPNIPPVHDLGNLPDGRPFLAMKLIKGHTLDSLLKARNDPAHDRGRLVSIFEQIAQGVAYAHAHRVVHRDLKPLNVMVGAFGEVQVMDWGLAKVLPEPGGAAGPADEADTGPETVVSPGRDGSDETRPGSVFGTPSYMPREQAIGAVDQVDARSDVFSLGGILCAILTGKPPYSGGDAESTRQLAALARLGDAFTRLDACDAEPGLVALCKRCLAAERDERPKDADVVAKSVADLRAEAEQRARQAEIDLVRTEGERAKAELQATEQKKRRRVQLALAAAASLLVAGAGGTALWKRAEDERAKLKDEQARLTESRLETDLARQETARVRAEAEAREQQQQLQARLDRNRVALLPVLARCEESLRLGDAYTAKLVMAEVEERSREHGTEAFAPRVKRCRADLAMLNELDRIVNLRLNPQENRFVGRETEVVEWEKAFEKYGIVPGKTPVAVVNQRVTDSLVRERLLATFDQWLLITRSPELAALLKDVDANPYRDSVRAALVAKDAVEIQHLLEQDAALKQPAWFAVMMGKVDHISWDRRRIILERAAITKPDDLTVLIGLTVAAMSDPNRNDHLRWAQAAVSAHPRNPTVRCLLGALLAVKGDWDGAFITLKEALRLDPKSAMAHGFLKMVVNLKANGKDGGIIEGWKETLKHDPNFAFGHLCLGQALRNAGGHLDEAIAEFKEAIRIDPRYALAHFELGEALQMKGTVANFLLRTRAGGNREGGNRHWNSAIAAYREAIRLDSTYAPAHSELGRVLRRKAFATKGDLAPAIASYREAIRLDPNSVPTHLALGDTLLEDHDLAAALAAYREAIRRNPKHAPAHVKLGHALKAKGDLDGAIAAWEEARRLDERSEVSDLLLRAHLERFVDALNADPIPPPREVTRP